MSINLFPGSEKFTLLNYEPDIFRLKTTAGGHPVWMFRDRPDDFAYGGNKVRFYEYLIPDIIASGAKILVSCGSLYSNHIRVTAEVAKRLGMECRILITDDEPGPEFFARKTNLSMAEDLGAEIIYIGSFAAMLKVQEYCQKMTDEGLSFYSVPHAGHTPVAVRAYANVMATALCELKNRDVRPVSVFLPCASGTTTAGLTAGARCMQAAGYAVPSIQGIAVANSPRGAARGIQKLLSSAGGQNLLVPDMGQLAKTSPYGTVAADAADILPEILDCGKNDYGKPDEALLDLRAAVLRDEGIELDRTYNINAFYGMLKYLEANPGSTPVLYINTGGYTG